MHPMERAIELASRQRPHPNPRVGAVIVDAAGRVIGEGAHVAPGTDHAEVVALKSTSVDVTGSTIYVTLEPCSHHGRTPPCADALIAAGISHVVVGLVDPDSKVAGQGVERLRNAGITVDTGVMAGAIEALDPGYLVHRRLGRSRMTLKLALTLDGNAAASDGTSQWITGELARQDSHRLRADSDAVMVGSGTVSADDPLLNVRSVKGR
ncbi:MAG: bifunctional diaminohydroxyphosphoribosylaminopyrimidine deaminase/5-amino-6-(5-phosphoribosylamino)uracil reductase RibD, partial [Acidimicrobiia bacterium]|nr:bifunctional diaminohydroxyphosphoribosylaminopyrimidine deaminase/5-amino-6-(5-phosphoribosylamino)uracil reductase RibD [Acidimicrobiia bacterium]